MASQAIKPIDRQSVHRICSGQVVLSLATAVKELLENSLDAGATCIEVRLKEYGSKCIEVIDNGCGVDEENYQSLTLKHHTSKLSEFSDLTEIDTFGFRGEALSSLCALGEMTVTTCTQTQEVGTKLQYDMNGLITSQSHVSRERGTTVSISNIFARLPVRYKQLQKNVKKEYAKLLQVIHAYCIISTGVRISCMNQAGKGPQNKVLATEGNKDIRGNFTNLFGSKATASIAPYIPAEKGHVPFSVTGYISKVDHGCGRGSADRQFFFVNNRPCDLPKLAKVINDVYHQYNHTQCPVAVINIIMNKDSCDINVTPDKRTILFHCETDLFDHIHDSLQAMYAPSRYTYELQNSTLTDFVSTAKPKLTPGAKEGSSQGEITRAQSPVHQSSTEIKKITMDTISQTVNGINNHQSLHINEVAARNFKEGNADDDTPLVEKQIDKILQDKDDNLTGKTRAATHCKRATSMQHSVSRESLSITDVVVEEEAGPAPEEEVKSSLDTLAYQRNSSPKQSKRVHSSKPAATSRKRVKHHEGETCEISKSMHDLDPEATVEKNDLHRTRREKEVIYDTAENQEDWPEVGAIEAQVKFNITSLKSKQARRIAAVTAGSGPTMRFRARINPESNQDAEAELARTFTKDSFSQMKVHGQFNLGFIIASLGNDLFIIDQHATDEKYNYETLQKTTKVNSQILIRPKPLELTASQESILLDNIGVFEQNGFKFHVEDEKAPGRRVSLTSIPYSKGTVFGMEDVEEVIFMLADSPGTMCRPTRVSKMFAMRACRTSVMIGTSLHKTEMYKLVRHMGEMEQPW
eukprot:Ihof_evm2s20 gene=Ihof_evmTU2s20